MKALSCSSDCLKTINRILLFSLAISLSYSAVAKVYKWVDENGKVHYSDKPFDDKSQEIEMKAEPTDAELSKAKKRANNLIHHQNKVLEMAEEDANKKLIDDAKKEKEKRKLTKLCNSAKTEINLLGRGYRSYTENKDGKRHYLSDQEKTDKIAEIQQHVDKNCRDL